MGTQTSVATKPTARSRVTNGSALFSNADGRSVASRRFRDIIAALVSDLGGSDICSEAQLSLCRRAAAMTVALEGREAEMVDKPDDFDLDEYGRAAGNLRRILETLGLKRVAKPIPDLQDYIRRERMPA